MTVKQLGLPALFGAVLAGQVHGPAAATIPTLTQKLPLAFEAAAPGKFLACGHGYELTLTAQEAVFRFPAATVRMRPVRVSPSARMAALEELPGKVNYFRGSDPSAWRTNLRTYGKIRVQSAYPGVDLVYYGIGRRLEFDFIAAPGADPGAVHLAFDGADQLTLDRSGDLVVHTGRETICLRRPHVYQENHGKRRAVEGRYVIGTNATVQFQVGAYDRQQTLVIDPVLDYSTTTGGDDSSVNAMAVDAQGAVYLAQSTINGALVAKLDPRGAGLIYSTRFPGFAAAIAVDAQGNAYVAGSTGTADFPTRNPVQRSLGGENDAFVLKLDATGSNLLYSTFLGGPKSDSAQAIAVDAAGRAHVTGSTQGGFPLMRALQSTFGGGEPGYAADAFVARLSADGRALEYSTYLGGNGNDTGAGIAVDAAGSAYVTGSTFSLDFPLRNALQNVLSDGPAFRTNDGGATWDAIPSGLPGSFIGALKIDPRNPATIYAAGWSGIARSTDGGDTWKQVNRGLHYLRIGMVAIDPHSSEIYLATFQGGIAEPPSLLYKSADGGENWRVVSLFDTEANAGFVSALAFDPSNAGLIYAGHSVKGVLKSTNGGGTWRATGLTEGALQVLLDPRNPAIVYANTLKGNLMKSEDAGQTWTPLSASTYLIALDPRNPKIMYAQIGNDLRKTADGGATWSSLGDGPWGGLVISPSNSQTLYASGIKGLLKSTDGGTTWRLAGLQRGVAAIAVDPTHEETVYVGTGLGTDAYVAKIDASGQSLVYSTYLGGGGSDRGNAIAVDSQGAAYIAGSTASTDFPVANAIQNDQTPGNPNGWGSTDAFVAKLAGDGSALEYATYLGGSGDDEARAIAVDAQGNAYVAGSTGSVDFPLKTPLQQALGGGGRIFRSNDSGATWSGLQANLNPDVLHLAVHPLLPSRLFAATVDGVFRSEDRGQNWVRTPLAQLVSGFAFDPAKAETIYAGSGRGVFVSTDGGDSWRLSRVGPDGPAVKALAVHPSHPPALYAGTDRGIFMSIDGGDRWEEVLPRDEPVYALAIAAGESSSFYALAFGGAAEAPAGDASVGCVDLLASMDGVTWSTVNRHVYCAYGLIPPYAEPEFSLFLDPQSPETLYAKADARPCCSDAALLRSTDGGTSFRSVPIPYDPCYVMTVIIDPRNPSTLYGGGGGPYDASRPGSGCIVKSTNGGDSWVLAGDGLGVYYPDGEGILALTLDPGNPTTIYAVTRIANDAWVAKLNSGGSALLYSTYLGGSGTESASAIALFGTNVYVAGFTASSDFEPGASVHSSRAYVVSIKE